MKMKEDDEIDIRSIIGLFIIFLGFVFVVTYIIMVPTKESLNVLLPVVATWVGTIIAFYFGKENFESANKTIKDITKNLPSAERLKTILAKDVMIPYDKMLKFPTVDKTTAKTIPLTKLIDFSVKNDISRVPIVDDKNRLIYLIHRSIVDLIISKYSITPVKGKEINTLTIQDLLDAQESKIYIKKQLSIKEDATLFDAKSAYDNEPNAQDVFVTKSGSIEDPILGWITQNEIIKNMTS